MDAARRAWLTRLSKASGTTVKDLSVVTPRQPFWLAALGEHLRVIGDPDADVFGGGPGTLQKPCVGHLRTG